MGRTEFPDLSDPENSCRRVEQLRLVSSELSEVSAQPKQKCEEGWIKPHDTASSHLTTDRTGRDQDGGQAAEVFLVSFTAVSRDLRFLPVHCQIQILFLPDGPGRAGTFTPCIIVSFLPEPLT